MRSSSRLCLTPRAWGTALAVLLALGVTASVVTAQQRPWRTLRLGTLLRLAVERDSAVWAFAIDSARIDLRGPCTGRDDFECPRNVRSIPLNSIQMATRRTDRVLEGIIIGAGLGAGVGALGYLRHMREGPGSWGDYTMPLFAAIGVVVGSIVGSNTHRWVRLPLPGP